MKISRFWRGVILPSLRSSSTRFEVQFLTALSAACVHMISVSTGTGVSERSHNCPEYYSSWTFGLPSLPELYSVSYSLG